MITVLVCGLRRLSAQPVAEIPRTSCRGSRLAAVTVTMAMQAVVAAIGASPAQAVTYWVTTVADNTTADDQCTLREAMLAANNTPANTDCGPGSAGRDDIVFGPFVPFTVLDAPLPTITDSVLILGDIAFGTTIDANGRVRAFVIDPGVDVTLSKLTITDAKAPDGHPVSTSYATPGGDGGAIYNRGRLHLEDVRVTQSAAGRGGDATFIGGTGGNGGAIYNAGTILGFRVTFDENSAGAGGRTDSPFPNKTGPGGHGGAIYNAAGGEITLYAATFWRNNQGRGATFYTPPTHGYGAAVFTAGWAIIKASTFVENGIGFFTGVIVTDGTGQVLLSSTVMAEDLDCQKLGEEPGGFFDGGYNLGLVDHPSLGTCGFFHFGSILDSSGLPVLETELRNNGGYVPTLALVSTSLALDKVPASFDDCAEGKLLNLGLPSTLTDARGVERPQNGNCDIGAFERGPSFRTAGRVLAITGAGSGHGTISGDGLDCAIAAGASAGQCSAEYGRGTVVTPTATAAADSILVGWAGDPECADGSVVMNGDKHCVAIFDLRGLSARGSANGVGNVRSPKSQGSAEVTFNAEFAFAGVIDLASATLTINALLSEEGASGAGELVQEVPIVLPAVTGGSTAAIFETPSGVAPRVTVEVIAQSSLSTVAIAIEGATIARFPQLCATARPSATTLTTRFTIEDGVNPPLTVTSREPWRCLAPTAGDRLQPRLLRTP
jgi:CSLREA domain-containing protein